jgi:hypothetical protein
MQKAGLESELLAVAAGADFAPDVPTSLQIGEYWLKVVDKNGVAYLDPCHEQNEFIPYRIQGLVAYNLKLKQLEKIPPTDWEQNGIEISGSAVMDPAGTSGTLLVTVRGIFNRYSAALESSSKFIAGLLKKIFPVEKAEVTKLLLLSRREIRVEATFSGQWLKDAGNGFFTVDACRLPGLSENMVQQVKRELSMVLDAPFKIALNLDLQPAAGLNLEYVTPDVQVKNEAGYFSRSHNLEKNGHIRFSESCGIEKTPVPVELYMRLREMLKAYFVPDFWLVLKKGK